MLQSYNLKNPNNNSSKVAEIGGNLKKKDGQNPWKNIMPGARDNMAFSLDHYSESSFYRPWPDFQCWLVQNDLNSETKITC